MSRLLSTLRLIGPRPLLLTRYVTHRLGVVLRRQLQRHAYSTLVVRGSVYGTDLPNLDVPRVGGCDAALLGSLQRVLDEADAALAHRTELLGSGPADLGDPIQWHRDVKSGYVWPRMSFLSLPVTRLDDPSDAKVPWELSRGHQLLALARAAVATSDDRYRRELELQWASWLDENPPGVGINWASTMEVGLRAITWVWILSTIEPDLEIAPDLRRRIISSLEAHAWHIAWNLEGTPLLRSNHFAANVAGLYVLGCVLQSRSAWWWRRLGARGLCREVARQFNADGTNFEASTAYHGLVLEMLVLARWIGARHGRNLAVVVDQTIARAAEASVIMRHPDGRAPLFGDNDSGRVLPLDAARQPTHDHVISLAAAALNAPLFEGIPPDPEVAWTFGVATWHSLVTRMPRPKPDRSDLTDGGLFVLTAGADNHLVVRNGDVGQAGNGGHAHNDLLAFELTLNRVLVVVDPGTYLYTADPRDRNRLRSVRAHSTVWVNGAEPNPIEPDRLFSMRGIAKPGWARPRAPGANRVEGWHDGFAAVGVARVCRRFVLHENVVDIEDELVGAGKSHVGARLQLAAGWRLSSNDPSTVTFADGTRLLTIAVEGHDELTVLTSAISDAYGHREQAPAVDLRCRASLPHRLSWRLSVTPVDPRLDDCRAPGPCAGVAPRPEEPR